jgi:outer membrane protein insertion porin family
VPVARIARVRFSGNKVVPSTQLENAMNVVAVGQPWREKQVRQLLDTTIRPIYEARGRVAVEFPKIDAEKEANVDGVVLTIAVNEGETFTIGAVTVQGAGDPAPLVKAMKLKKGDLFNGEAVQEGATRVENMLKREGHMRAKTRIERKVDPKARTVSVNIVAEPGPQFRFGKLNIEGLDVTTEPVVRKLWSVKPGAPFNADYPDYFLTQLREQGYFENLGKTQSKVSLDEENRVADVTLIFHAAPQQQEKKEP